MKRPLALLFAVIGILWLSNLLVSSMLGLGDAEALYYLYSRHPAFSYLDHPPLIGWLIRMTCAAAGETVLGVRLVPMLMSALCLVFSFLCTQEMFGKKAAAICVVLLFASPVFSIGMTAASPDAPLAALVMLFTWQLHRALNTTATTSGQRFFIPMVLGAVLGGAFLAKYTGACLGLSALIVLGRKENRRRLKEPGTYLGASTAMLLALPVFVWNLNHDWIGATQRLVYTQTDAGFSLRNLGALFGGQLLYVGPLVMLLFGFAIKHHFTAGDKTAAEHRARLLLLTVSFPTLLLMYLLVGWSKTAEPHWPAAGYLPLYPLAAGFIASAGKSIQHLFRWTAGLGAALFLIAHIVVLTPLVPAWIPSPIYEPKYDLANELRGWPEVAETIRELNPEKKPVVAAFYTQCSQLAFQLNRKDDPKVRCVSKEIDDFDIWYGPFVLEKQGALFVTDNRFEQHPTDYLKGATEISQIAVSIERAGKEVRRFEIEFIGPGKSGEPGKSGQGGQ